MIEIKNWRGLVLHRSETATTLIDALRKALQSGADLRGAYLSGADLSDAVLRDADLSGADLSGADLSGADLRDADLSGADLSGADLSDADLSGADLSGADLSGAVLTSIREDVEAICAAAPAEVPALLAAIREGRMDGSHYEGECSCLLGTIATTRGVHYTKLPGLVPDSSRPAEAFATAVRRGDTPATNQVAALLDEWIAAWLARSTP